MTGKLYVAERVIAQGPEPAVLIQAKLPLTSKGVLLKALLSKDGSLKC